jgi:hypothetical protein
MMLVWTAKPPPSHDPFLHAPRHHRLEQLAQEIALAKAAMSILGKRPMIGSLAVETQATEPAVGKIEVNLFAHRRSERMPKQ